MRKRGTVRFEHVVAEAREDDLRHIAMRFRECGDFAHRNRDGFLDRITVDAATDRRKRDGPDPMVAGERKRMAIAACEEVRFACMSAAPYRSNRMDDVARRQTIAPRNAGFARRATADRPAFVQQLRPGGSVERSVDTPAAQQRRIGGVYDRVDV